MPYEMRARRPLLPNAGPVNAARTMAAGGGVATVQGTPAGAVSPGTQAGDAGGGASMVNTGPGGTGVNGPQVGGARPNAGERTLAGAAGKPGDAANGLLGSGALSGSQPLGGTRSAGAGASDLRPVSSTPLLTGAQAGAVNETRTLSRASGDGARSTTAYGVGLNDKGDALAAQKQLADVSRGRPPGSSLPPIGGVAPRLPGAVAGPGAAPASSGAPPTPYVDPDGQNGVEGVARTGWNQTAVPKDQTSLPLAINDEDIAGYTKEGWQVLIGTDGQLWAQSDAGFIQVTDADLADRTGYTGASSRDSRTEQRRAAEAQASAEANPYESLSDDELAARANNPTEMLAVYQELQRRKERAAARPAGPAYGTGHSGGSAPGGSAYGTGRSGLSAGASAPAAEGQAAGPSEVAASVARRVGQDPALIQWLIDNGISPQNITKDGVRGIDDPDFAGGDAEWDDMYDPEAGLLFRAGQEYRNAGQAAGAEQASGDARAQIEQLLARLQGMQAPGIDPAVFAGLLRAQQQSNAFRQSQALATTLADAAASGLSAGAATGTASRMMTDFTNTNALQEGQLRMQGALANLPGQQQKFGAVSQAMGLLPQLAMQKAGASNQAGIQAMLMQLQQRMGWSDAEFQQNMQDGFLDYLGGILGGAVNGAAAGLGNAAGGALSKKLGLA